MIWKQMGWGQRTKFFVTLIVLLVGGYDLVAITIGGTDASISRVLLRDATIVPAIPFALGFVAGHLFWNQPPPPKEGA